MQAQGKISLLDSIKTIRELARLHYIEQEKPLGLGHAILTAHKQIGNEYFGIILPDDIILDDQPGIGQLISIAENTSKCDCRTRGLSHTDFIIWCNLHKRAG